MAYRIDWLPIRTKYLSSDTETLRTCAEKFNVDYGTVRQKASDEAWSFQKARLRQSAVRKLDDETVSKLEEMTRKQIALSRTLQAQAAKLLAEGVEPETPHEVCQWLKTGIVLERLCLGMDSPKQPKRIHTLHKDALTPSF